MYKVFKIEKFRGFKEFEIGDLERLNLIAGKNDVGKTAFLEALWLHHGGDNPTLGVKIDNNRGIRQFKAQEFLWDLFRNFQPNTKVRLSTREEEEIVKTTTISIERRKTFPVEVGDSDETIHDENEVNSEISELISPKVVVTHQDQSGKHYESEVFITKEDEIQAHVPQAIQRANGIFLAAQNRISAKANAERFGNLRVTKEQNKIINILRHIDSRITDLVIVSRGGNPIIHAELQGVERLLPVSLLGDGVYRLLSYCLAITDAGGGGVTLIDEIENGLHYSVITNIWKEIAILAREYDVQVFATTHSWECIKAAHKAFANTDKYDFRLHRLDRVNGIIESETYDQDSLKVALEQGLEVR